RPRGEVSPRGGLQKVGRREQDRGNVGVPEREPGPAELARDAMNMPLFFRVISRFKILVGVGFVVALAFSFLSLVSVGFDHGSVKTHFRTNEQWVSRSTLLVTERRFPLGRSVLDDATPTTPSQIPSSPSAQPFAPSTRFTELANIYAELATSDAVRQYIRRDGPL